MIEKITNEKVIKREEKIIMNENDTVAAPAGAARHCISEEIITPNNRKISSSSTSAPNNDDDNIIHFHSAKTSPATIQWLLQHYEVAEGVSLPRHILYGHYMRHCQECNIEPANSASFGKLIRSVFYGVAQYNAFLAAAASVKIQVVEIPPLHQFESHFRMIGVTMDQVVHFMTMYKQHCEDILDCVKRLNFDSVSILWREFWQPDDDFSYETTLEDNRSPVQKTLTISHFTYYRSFVDRSNLSLNRNRLFTISTLPVVQSFVREVDVRLYQAFISVLIPDVLRPIPSALIQHIRTFCKRLESQLAESMQGAPEDVVSLKVDAVATLAHTLRRYTCLNHVAQTARAVLSNADQIGQMLADLNKIDFRSLHAQACWACSCNSELLSEIDSSFKSALEKCLDLEQWASWLNNIVDKILSSETHYPSSLEEFIDTGKRLMLNSLIMRDLTLRSAVTFGSFHLMRLLYDEYVFYLIEQKICKITGQSVITVMSPMCIVNVFVYQRNLEYQSSSRLGTGFSEIQYDLMSNASSIVISPHIVENKSIFMPNQSSNDVGVTIFHNNQTTAMSTVSDNSTCEKVIEVDIPSKVQQAENAEATIAETLNVDIEEFFATASDLNIGTLEADIRRRNGWRQNGWHRPKWSGTELTGANDGTEPS
uniref:RFX-type winged-helix domain-containing protein n=1 Tax=Romanomermis culicivorax TaxID=13658 RepID=A0A915I7T0_ROMCU